MVVKVQVLGRDFLVSLRLETAPRGKELRQRLNNCCSTEDAPPSAEMLRMDLGGLNVLVYCSERIVIDGQGCLLIDRNKLKERLQG